MLTQIVKMHGTLLPARHQFHSAQRGQAWLIGREHSGAKAKSNTRSGPRPIDRTFFYTL
jgi:hypothetical protein